LVPLAKDVLAAVSRAPIFPGSTSRGPPWRLASHQEFCRHQDNLSGVNLTDLNLTDVTLTGANLTGATLTGANLTGTVLVPADQSVLAASHAGTVVTWPAPPSLPGATPGICTPPPSGSIFPLGVTTITCQVLDDHGGVATGTFTVTVGVDTTTSLSLASNPAVVNQFLTYTATVSPTPTGGTVAFTSNGELVPGCSAVPLSGGSATCSTNSFDTPTFPASFNIVATYRGSGAFFGSTSPTVAQVVMQKPTCHKLAGCNLSGFFFVGVNFAGVDLLGTNLAGANLSGADLSGANLQGANLMGANLSFANLSGANLKGANLNNVTWSNTTCPDGTISNKDGGTCVGHGI
jgi:hypothetical protein